MSAKKVEISNKAKIVKSSILTQEKITRNQGNKSWKTTTARRRTIPSQGTKETIICLPHCEVQSHQRCSYNKPNRTH